MSMIRRKILWGAAMVGVLVASAACSDSASTTPVGPGEGTGNNNPPGSGTSTASPGSTGNPAGTSTSNPGGGTAPNTSPGADITSDQTWVDGTVLAASTTIEAGVTVTIAPGAKITAPSAGNITVLGTLTSASATGTHASISASAWSGIIVAAGGALKLDGTDISGATNGLTTQTGNAASTYSNGTIDGAATPFLMGTGSQLSVAHMAITHSGGQSQIKGTFVASYMDYDKGNNEGIVLGDPSGSLDIEQSTLHGTNSSGDTDFVVSETGKFVKVTYTTISGAHCGFHFDSVGSFTIDHVTSSTNSYGAMLYGSGVGPNTISYSNFADSVSLDITGTNGAITIDNTYTNPGPMISGSVPKITNNQTAVVTGAGPQ